LTIFKQLRLAAAFACAVLALSPALASAQVCRPYASHVYTKNNTDKWVWVTAIESNGNPTNIGPTRSNAGAWCVGPNAYDKHGLRTVLVAYRAEIMSNSCSHKPNLADKSVAYEWHWGTNGNRPCDSMIEFGINYAGSYYISTRKL